MFSIFTLRGKFNSHTEAFGVQMLVFDGSAGGMLGAVQVKSAIFFPLS